MYINAMSRGSSLAASSQLFSFRGVWVSELFLQIQESCTNRPNQSKMQRWKGQSETAGLRPRFHKKSSCVNRQVCVQL